MVGEGGGGGFHGHSMSGGGRGSITSPVRSAGGEGGSSVPGAGFCLSNISGSTPAGGGGGGFHLAPSIRTPFEEGKSFIHVFSFTVSKQQS